MRIHADDSSSQSSHIVIFELAIIVMVFTCPKIAYTRPYFEGGDFDSCFMSKALQDAELTLELNEQFRDLERGERSRERDLSTKDSEIRYISDDYPKNSTHEEDEGDVVDREDHVTQYLSELLVNTDSEITSLQASELEEGKEEYGHGSNVKEDAYFAFLTSQEKVFEVDGVCSVPGINIIEENSDFMI